MNVFLRSLLLWRELESMSLGVFLVMKFPTSLAWVNKDVLFRSRVLEVAATQLMAQRKALWHLPDQ